MNGFSKAQAEYEARLPDESSTELLEGWQEAVAAGDTLKSFEAWCDDLEDNNFEEPEVREGFDWE
jgi:hypothetical protein